MKMKMIKQKADRILEVPISKVRPNPEQPRKTFDKEQLDELAQSIKTNKQITPIVVSKEKGKDSWMIVSGERRYRAIKQLGLKNIKVIEKEYENEILKEIEALIENVHRSDLTEKERYFYLKRIKERENLSFKELSQRTGIKERTIYYIFDVFETRKLLDKATNNNASSYIISVSKSLPVDDRIKLIKRAVKNKEGGRQVIEVVKTLNQIEHREVKDAIIQNIITIQQAKNISKIPDKSKREHAINEFKSLRCVQENIIKNSKTRDIEKRKREFRKKLEKSGEWIKGFKSENVATLRQLEKTIRVLLTAVNCIDCIDDVQKETLLREIELFIQKCERGAYLAEEIKNKIDKKIVRGY